MKKIFAGLVVVATVAAVLVNRGSPKEKAPVREIAGAPKGAESRALEKSLISLPLPKEFSDLQNPETIADAQRKIREASDLLRRQLVPLMKQVPGEIVKMEALMKQNDELIDAIARTTEFRPPTGAKPSKQN